MNYNSPELLLSILQAIDSRENIERKNISFAQYEIFQDNLMPAVKTYLKSMYSSKTLEEMPIIGSVNLARRVVIQEASIYKASPKRTFQGLSEDQVRQIEKIYEDLQIDAKLLKSNQYYKLQHQNHLQVLLRNGKLHLRVLLNHHLDVVPSPMNPDEADAYIVNGYDKSQDQHAERNSDGINQVIGDADDYKASMERYALWSNEFNFIFNGKGQIVSGADISNGLKRMPFVDVSPDKDYEYWLRGGTAVTDFTIQFNGALSDLGHIVRMQGFAQAWMKGPADMIPENIQIGPSFVIKLPIDPDKPTETDFGFSNPAPDLSGSIAYVEMLLSNFLSSRGLDPKLVSGKGEADKFSSGIERLLSLLEKFEASRSDLATYMRVEREIFEIVKAYVNTYGASDLWDYELTSIPEDAEILVEFQKPEMIQSEQEKLDAQAKKLDIGLTSRIRALMELHGISKDQAVELAEEIDKENSEFALAGAGNLANDPSQDPAQKPAQIDAEDDSEDQQGDEENEKLPAGTSKRNRNTRAKAKKSGR